MQNWPQYLVIGYWIFTSGTNFAVAVVKGSMPVTTTPWERFWLRLVGTMTLATVLQRGGFFASIGWPA